MRIILSAISLLLLATAAPAHAGPTMNKIKEAGKIRCGYAMWHPAFFMNLETNELSGIFYDLINEAGNRLDLEIEWAEEASWGTIVEGLHSKRYDMICSAIGHSSTRSKFIEFGTPIAYTPMYAVVRKDDTRFDDNVYKMDDPEVTIAILEGELSAITAKQIFKTANVTAMPQILDYSQLLKELEAGKADSTLVDPGTFHAYDQNNPDKLRLLNPKNPINVFPLSVGLPQDDSAFNQMINVTLNELVNDGTVERLIQKYEETPGSFLRTQKPYKASE